MVDYDPFKGNYTNTIVQNNIIAGGFATDLTEARTEAKGDDEFNAIVKSVPDLFFHLIYSL